MISVPIRSVFIPNRKRSQIFQFKSRRLRLAGFPCAAVYLGRRRRPRCAGTAGICCASQLTTARTSQTCSPPTSERSGASPTCSRGSRASSPAPRRRGCQSSRCRRPRRRRRAQVTAEHLRVRLPIPAHRLRAAATPSPTTPWTPTPTDRPTPAPPSTRAVAVSWDDAACLRPCVLQVPFSQQPAASPFPRWICVAAPPSAICSRSLLQSMLSTPTPVKMYVVILLLNMYVAIYFPLNMCILSYYP